MPNIARILVVDDEEDVIAFVRRLLSSKTTHWVEATTDPIDALRRFRNAPFDLVISDIAMPGMRGTVLAEAIHAVSPNTRIIFMSGEELEQEAKMAGAIAFLRKPVSSADLLEAVAQALACANCDAGEATGRKR